MLLRKINSQALYVIFIFLQIITIAIYLLSKSNIKLSHDIYLQTVKISTLFLLTLSLILLIKNKLNLFKFNPLKVAFLLQILILYFTMIIHTDIKAINSPTIIFMALSFLIFSSLSVSENFINQVSIFLAIINLLFVFLQFNNIIPVAQTNERESFGISDNRPTGILFNAFALGYASAIIFLILLYFLVNKKNTFLNLIGLGSSYITALLSATRTPIVLILFLSVIIILQKTNIIYKNWKAVTFSSFSFAILFPVVSIFYGNYKNLESYSNLNGRIYLWECVLNRCHDFIPFGVGVQAAFPKGFCSDDPWFANLRHPESMFFLNFVESGIIGVLGLIFLFLVTFWKSAEALREKNALPLTITTVYFMCCIFYVPLFHYLPFLENRPADRGIFNFFLFTLMWLIILVTFIKDNKQTITKK